MGTMKHEYHEGPKTGENFKKGAEARKSFETTMTKLFRVPKTEGTKPKLKKGDNEK
jgi:hypothetical protein